MNRFSSIVSSSPSEKLVIMVTRERDEFEPEAIAAAEEELSRRGVSWKKENDEEGDYLIMEDLPEDFKIPGSDSEETDEPPINLDLHKDNISKNDTTVFELLNKEVADKEALTPEQTQRKKNKRSIIAGSIFLVIGLVRVSMGMGTGYPLDYIIGCLCLISGVLRLIYPFTSKVKV